eukprot:947519-Pleurochrysis_carterae.AAC.1
MLTPLSRRVAHAGAARVCLPSSTSGSAHPPARQPHPLPTARAASIGLAVRRLRPAPLGGVSAPRVGPRGPPPRGRPPSSALPPVPASRDRLRNPPFGSPAAGSVARPLYQGVRSGRL